MRDRLVAAVLAAGVLLGMAAWQGIGPLLGLAVGVLAIVVASAVYRVDRTGPRTGEGDEPVDAVLSTRRRAEERL